MGPVLSPQRLLASHWLLLCGNSSPRLLAISMSRKSQKNLPIFSPLTQNKPEKNPITWAKQKPLVHWVQPRGCQFTTSGLCLAREFLLGSKKWGPLGFPHTYQDPILTEASGGPKGLQLSHRGPGGRQGI